MKTKNRKSSGNNRATAKTVIGYTKKQIKLNRARASSPEPSSPLEEKRTLAEIRSLGRMNTTGPSHKYPKMLKMISAMRLKAFEALKEHPAAYL